MCLIHTLVSKDYEYPAIIAYVVSYSTLKLKDNTILVKYCGVSPGKSVSKKKHKLINSNSFKGQEKHCLTYQIRKHSIILELTFANNIYIVT